MVFCNRLTPLAFERNLNAYKLLILDHNINLRHRCSKSHLCTTFKIHYTPIRPIHSELPCLFHTVRVTRNAVNSHSHSSFIFKCSIVQYSKCFIPTSTSRVVECVEFQKFNVCVNKLSLERHN